MQVRRSIIAGQWYPGRARELRRTIEGYLASIEPTGLHGELMGLISPHAGYVYSGQTAAYAYSQLQNRSFDAIVILSPLHRLPLGRFAVTDAAAYETPLGQVPVDSELVSALESQVHLNRVGYDGEHSLEIQLPFLQVALGEFALLPVMIGESSFEAGVQLGQALAHILANKRALLIASTDMHHIENYDQVVHRDRTVIDALVSFDMTRIQDALAPWDCSVCGRIPVYAMLTATRALGADKIQILHHTNSGDVTGHREPGQYTVGYLAAAVYKSQ